MSRHSLLAACAGLLIAGLGLLPARPVVADSGYLIHVRIADAGDDSAVEIALPWKRSHGGSPFDFSDDDDLPVERLRWAWTTLQRMPEGEAVRVTRRDETTRLYRLRGRLVIEPERGPRGESGRITVPGEIVDAILRRDGRLEDRDLEHLLARRGRVDLVTVDGDDGLVRVWIGRSRRAD